MSVSNIEISSRRASPEIAGSTSVEQLCGMRGREVQGEPFVTFVNRMVAAAFSISSDQLLGRDRGNRRTIRARQIAMYLLRTSLSMRLCRIAEVYGRDRTTIAHACSVVEDLRDRPDFDSRMMELEKTLEMVVGFAVHGVALKDLVDLPVREDLPQMLHM